MAEFDTWATSPRAIIRDDSLSFEAEPLKQACETWKQLGDGAIPPRSRFSARAVKLFVGHLVIFERLMESDYLVRLMGTRVTGIIGEMQGKSLSEALPSATIERWVSTLNDVLMQRKPARIVTRVSFNNLHYLEAEIFMAPLTDDHGAEKMVMAAVAFRSGLAKAASLADIVGAK